MEFKKRLKLELSDYTAFNFFVFRKLFILIPIIAILVTFMIHIYEIMGRNIFEIVFLALGTAAFVTLGFFFLIKYSVKKTYKSTKAMQMPHEVVLNDTGFHTSGESGTMNISWQDIYKAAETKAAVYIYLLKAQAFMIPKRLVTSEEAATIRTLIAKNLSPEKNKLREI